MMRASDFRREARESLKGHKGKAGGTYLVYFIVSMLLGLVLSFIPIIGPLFLALIVAGIMYGCVTVLMRIRRKEDVSAFNCVSEGFSKFWKVFVCNFWICIKLLPWILMYVIAVIISWMGNFAGGLEYETNNSSAIIFGSISGILIVVSLVMIIVKSFKYSLVNFLIYDEPDLKAKEIVNKSAELMKGNCGRIFCLNLSFIGWGVLLIIGIYASALMISVGTFAMLFGGFSAMFLIGIIGSIVVGFLSVFFLTPYMQMSNICFYEELVKPNNEDGLKNDFDDPINEDNGGIAMI